MYYHKQRESGNGVSFASHIDRPYSGIDSITNIQCFMNRTDGEKNMILLLMDIQDTTNYVERLNGKTVLTSPTLIHKNQDSRFNNSHLQSCTHLIMCVRILRVPVISSFTISCGA